MRQLVTLTLVAVSLLGSAQIGFADWPMWRYDAGHTASSPDSLPHALGLKWYREESPRLPVWDDPLNRDLMPYDRVFEPIVADGRIYLPYNDSDKVVCFSLGTGDVEWTYFADGPVRFPPVAANGKIYCVSDDGWLHCLDGRTGKVVWKHQGGPTDRKVLGNERIISMWPARGGPVVRDGDCLLCGQYLALSRHLYVCTRCRFGRGDLG